MDDMLHSTLTQDKTKSSTESEVNDESGSVPMLEAVDENAIHKWLEHSFIKPLRILGELSGFNSLIAAYTKIWHV